MAYWSSVMMSRSLGLLLLGVEPARGYPGMTAVSPASVGDALPDYVATPFPEGMLGTWNPAAPPQSILGPLAYEFITAGGGAFSAQRDPATGDVWLTILAGQTFRVRENSMQYCFGYTAPDVREQSPFSVNSTSDSAVTFCWRDGLAGMQTHTTGCSGCDCAKITITLKDKDNAELTFWQSPPVIHAHIMLKRAAKAPTMKQITKTLPKPYENCKITDQCIPWQFCPPSTNTTVTEMASAPQRPAGCAYAAMMQARQRGLLPAAEAESQQVSGSVDPEGPQTCFQLNGDNLAINDILPEKLRYDIPDIKMQIIKPTGPCDPCNVSYAVSALLKENEYVAVGFKGQSWEGETPSHPTDKRPCYFGMCVDPFDNFTTDRIAVGYATSARGACVREMISEDIVGEPSDVDFEIFSGTSVARTAGRTVMHFTVPQHWPKAPAPVPGLKSDGYFRVMWARGTVSGGRGCNASIGFHGIDRGVAPLEWLQINSHNCVFDSPDSIM